VLLVLGGLRLQGLAVQREWVGVRASRKLAHLALGLVLLVSWLLYDDAPSARWWAALPPAVLAGYFVALGAGVKRDDRSVRALSRSGAAREMLLGPVLFTVPFALLTVFLWRSPVAVAALAFLIVGDGVAEPVGRAVKSRPLHWNRDKTMAGSLGAVLFGWLACVCVFRGFHAAGYLVFSAGDAWRPLMVVALVGALTESMTSGQYDNLTVTVACALTGWIVF